MEPRVKDTAERFWDEAVGRHREPFVHWESPSSIAAWLNRIVSGSSEIDSVTWFIQTYGPFSCVAELGCGDGDLARMLGEQCPQCLVEAYDFSEGSLAVAAKKCQDMPNVSLHRLDLNTQMLTFEQFDAIFCTGTLHHIENLDFALTTMANSLKPNGVIWLNDYFGPARYQWSDTQMRLATDLLMLVPKKWRRSDKIIRYPAAYIEELDPSEAVAPHVIEDAFLSRFEVLRCVPRGGTLLAPIFGSGCLDSSMEESEEGRAMLEALYLTERKMIAEKALKSDTFLYVGRKRPASDTIVQRYYAELNSKQAP